MRKTINIITLFLSVSLFASSGGDEKEDKKEVEVNNSEPITYVIGISRRGENWESDSLEASELLEQHLNFIQNLIVNKKLIASGPLKTTNDARGLYVFNVKTIKEAKALTAKDKAMNSGWITMDFHVWDSRDYTIPEVVPEEGESSFGVKTISIVFAIVILIFVLRTFRYKPNV